MEADAACAVRSQILIAAEDAGILADVDGQGHGEFADDRRGGHVLFFAAVNAVHGLEPNGDLVAVLRRGGHLEPQIRILGAGRQIQPIHADGFHQAAHGCGAQLRHLHVGGHGIDRAVQHGHDHVADGEGHGVLLFVAILGGDSELPGLAAVGGRGTCSNVCLFRRYDLEGGGGHVAAIGQGRGVACAGAGRRNAVDLDALDSGIAALDVGDRAADGLLLRGRSGAFADGEGNGGFIAAGLAAACGGEAVQRHADLVRAAREPVLQCVDQRGLAAGLGEIVVLGFGYGFQIVDQGQGVLGLQQLVGLHVAEKVLLRLVQGAVVCVCGLNRLPVCLGDVLRQGLDLVLQGHDRPDVVHRRPHVLQGRSIDPGLLRGAELGDHSVDGIDLLLHRLIIGGAHILRGGQGGNELIHIVCAVVRSDDMEGVPSGFICSCFRSITVHGGPRLFANANINHIARFYRDILSTFIEAVTLIIGGDLLVKESLDQIVLICGGGR